MFALKDENGTVTTNMKKVVTVAKKFYTNLYCDLSEQEGNGGERKT